MLSISKKLRIKGFSWRRRDVITMFYWLISVLIWEVSAHLICYRSFTISSIFLIPFSALFSIILTFLTRLCSEKWNRRWTLILTIVLFIFYASQIVYHRVFGGFYSVKMVKLGGTAVRKFWKETIFAILYSWWQLLLQAIPIGLYVLRKRRFPATFEKRTTEFNRILFGIIVLFWVVCVTSLRLGGTKRHSPFGAYHSNTIVTSECVNKLGLMPAMRLELHQLLFPSDQDVVDYELVVTRLPKIAGVDQNNVTTISKSKNELNIDFETLDTYSYDERVQALNKYFSYAKPTSKNGFTGRFRGRNLIEFCAESFSPLVISEDLTPALYRLTHEGFEFTNYYTSFQNTTTNCEYAFCMGLMPDMTRNKWDASFIPSANNYLPYCTGNAFRRLGYHTFFFHNNVGDFYQRNVTHPNMGFECYFEKDNYDDPNEVGMVFTTDEEPTSDLEMVQQSLPIVLEQGEPFVAYYMTYSGHYDYDFDLNPMCAKNREVIEEYVQSHGLEYSDKVKAYLSCNLELEYALEYLLQELEEYDMIDDTVIVLTTDHYPYGLNKDEYNELAGRELDEPFERMQNAFILWTGDMKEPVVCDSYCCNIDILPTILNLFGVKYDSRLLAGVDVFSDGPHIAFLTDESFRTNVMEFNSTSNKLTYFVDESMVPESYFDTVVQIIQNKINMSSLILYSNYYKLVFNPTRYVSPNEGKTQGIPLGYYVIAGVILIVVAVEIIRHLKRKRMKQAVADADVLCEDAVEKTDSAQEKEETESEKETVPI